MTLIKGFIFDLDGTLLDTLEDLSSSANRVLLKYGYSPKTPEETKYLVGEGLRRLLQKIAGLDAENPELEDMAASFMEDYADNLMVTTRPYPGIRRMLGALGSAKLPLAVFSNKSHELTVLLIQHFFPEIPFRKVLGKQENTPAKPDPAGVSGILEALRLPAEKVAFVGDTGVDMRTAVNSGLFPIGVSWGFRPEDELLEQGAKIILKRPEELLEQGAKLLSTDWGNLPRIADGWFSR
jgi:phosphoglycolate phosphatase